MGSKHSKTQDDITATSGAAGTPSCAGSTLLSSCSAYVSPSEADASQAKPLGPAKHFLFIIGGGMLLPIGQEPYASFQVTRVTSGTAPSRCSSSGSLASLHGSSPRGCSPPRMRDSQPPPGYPASIPEQHGDSNLASCSTRLSPWLAPDLRTTSSTRQHARAECAAPTPCIAPQGMSVSVPAQQQQPHVVGLGTGSMTPAGGSPTFSRSSTGGHAAKVVTNTLRHQGASFTAPSAQHGSFTATAVVSALDMSSMSSMSAWPALGAQPQQPTRLQQLMPPCGLGCGPDTCPPPIRAYCAAQGAVCEPLLPSISALSTSDSESGSTKGRSPAGGSPTSAYSDSLPFQGGASSLVPTAPGGSPQAPGPLALAAQGGSPIESSSPTGGPALLAQVSALPRASWERPPSRNGAATAPNGRSGSSQSGTPRGSSPPPPGVLKRTSGMGGLVGGGPGSSSLQPLQAPALPLQTVVQTVSELRAACPSLFIIVWHPSATEDGEVRAEAFAAGANMVTCSQQDLSKVLRRIACQSCQGSITCDWCGLKHLTLKDYWVHQPLYHIYHSERRTWCQICNKAVPNLAVHVHEEHAPGGPKYEARSNYGSALVVHRPADNKFLMVQEFAGQGFWTPGGMADPGEGLVACAARECVEETGVEVEVMALLEVQHDMSQSPPWRLAVFYAQPKDPGQMPKTVPDFESAGACWVSAEQLRSLPLREVELPTRWYHAVAQGTAQMLPLGVPAHAVEQFKDLTW